MPHSFRPSLHRLAVAAGALGLCAGAWAQQAPGESRLKLSGFVSAIGTQMLDEGLDTDSYGGYRLDKAWELQLGRRRMPLHYGAEAPETDPWSGRASALYGLDAGHYTGASLRYGLRWGQTHLSAGLFGGREDLDRTSDWRLYDADRSRTMGKNILGADLEVSRGPLTLRGTYMTSDLDGMAALPAHAGAKLTAYGIAVNLDLDSWFLLSEVSRLTRASPLDGLSYSAPMANIGAGLRLGRWTPSVSYAQYVDNAGDLGLVPTTYRRGSAALRYDLNGSSGIKLQLDRSMDLGNSLNAPVTVLRLSFDRAF